MMSMPPTNPAVSLSGKLSLGNQYVKRSIPPLNDRLFKVRAKCSKAYPVMLLGSWDCGDGFGITRWTFTYLIIMPGFFSAKEEKTTTSHYTAK
jgi:hypothetical protein